MAALQPPRQANGRFRDDERRLIEDLSLQFKVLLERRESIIKTQGSEDQSRPLCDLYESSITPLLAKFLELGSLIVPKHPGGRPQHGHVGIALLLQKERYDSQGTFYKAKELVRAVKSYAADEAHHEADWERLVAKYGKRKATQNEMSEGIARECIQTFKVTLNIR